MQLLAEATTVCPDCQGYDASLRLQGLTYFPNSNKPLCGKCDKDGKVPLIPGLRKACSASHTKSVYYDWGEGAGIEVLSCAEAGCSGWVPVLGAEAVMAMMEFVLAQQMAEGWTKWVSFERPRAAESTTGYRAYIPSIDWHRDFVGYGDTLEAALAEALCRALKLMPDERT